MENIKKFITLLFIIIAYLTIRVLIDKGKPTGYDYEDYEIPPVTEECPYCQGGYIRDIYGYYYKCSKCNGAGYTVIFKGEKKRKKILLDEDMSCPIGKTTFACYDENKNGIINSSDRCIHCGKEYQTHRGKIKKALKYIK